MDPIVTRGNEIGSTRPKSVVAAEAADSHETYPIAFD